MEQACGRTCDPVEKSPHQSVFTGRICDSVLQGHRSRKQKIRHEVQLKRKGRISGGCSKISSYFSLPYCDFGNKLT